MSLKPSPEMVSYMEDSDPKLDFIVFEGGLMDDFTYYIKRGDSKVEFWHGREPEGDPDEVYLDSGQTDGEARVFKIVEEA